MTNLKEIKSKFAVRQVAQGAHYFDILETRGLAKGFWNMKMAKAKSL